MSDSNENVQKIRTTINDSIRENKNLQYSILRGAIECFAFIKAMEKVAEGPQSADPEEMEILLAAIPMIEAYAKPDRVRDIASVAILGASSMISSGVIDLDEHLPALCKGLNCDPEEGNFNAKRIRELFQEGLRAGKDINI